jgi:hypothetical protein
MQSSRKRKRSAIEALSAVVPSTVHLFEGKVADLERRTAAGFSRGSARIEGTGTCRGSVMWMEFQNEFLIARTGVAEDVRVRVMVPDLLVLLEEESGLALSTEDLRYGMRICALGLPAPRELKTAQALRYVGPRAFGYDMDFVPLPGDLSS